MGGIKIKEIKPKPIEDNLNHFAPVAQATSGVTLRPQVVH